MEILLYLMAFLIVIFVLVSIHEAGHFLAARFLGIGVTNFAIGMGPVLLSKKGKQTSYELRALPIGGFVKMVGDVDPASLQKEEQIKEAEKLTEEEKKQSFFQRPNWQKAIVVIAGPLANFVLGVALFVGLFMYVPDSFTKPIVSEVIKGSPAEKAGVQVGDEFLYLNGSYIRDFNDVKQIVSVSLDNPIEAEIKRGDNKTNLTIIPEIQIIDTFTGEKARAGRIGIVANQTEMKMLSFSEAFEKGWNQFNKSITVLGTALKQIFQGERSVKDMGGPVKIAEVSGEAYKISFTFFIFIMATLSINLGIINLLPIPVLDGGHLVIYTIESIKGSTLNPKGLEYVQKASMIFLLGLMIFITYHDIYSLIERKFG
jgi:regulator of sigma E protease